MENTEIITYGLTQEKKKPSFENLVQFDGEPVCWGINYAPYNHARYRHDEFEARTIGNVFITRNGEKILRCKGWY